MDNMNSKSNLTVPLGGQKKEKEIKVENLERLSDSENQRRMKEGEKKH